MTNLFDEKRVFLVGGSGGVGKTTLAAALGVAFAEEGHKTLVLTVDPARRLAQALGLERFTGDIQKVPTEKGELFASMLDSKRYFDRVIERFATSPEQREKILNNQLYRVMVDHLGGSHEYAAMERLLEFSGLKEYTKIVVDTPPTQNAVDLLSAPQRLADFMDNSVLKWFQGSKTYLSIFRQGTKLAMKMLHMVFGMEFVENLQTVFKDLEGMQAGFRTRHLEVIKLLQSREAGFLLVTFPSEARVLEAESFQKALKDFQISLAGIIFNRLEPNPPETDAGFDAETQKLITFCKDIYEAQQRWAAKLINVFQNTPRFYIPKDPKGLHDLKGLGNIGKRLFASNPN